MAAPQIIPLPAPPVRSDAPADFSSKADAFVAALPGFATQANAQAEFTESRANEVESAIATVAASADSAQASANSAESSASAAESSASEAAASELNAQAAAAAAGAAIGLPALAGNARKPLRVLLDETGVEFADVLALTAVMEKTAVIPTASGSTALNLSAASLFDITLSANTTLTISSPPVFLDETLAIVVRITQGATARTLTWFPNISWLTVAGAAPSAPGANRIVEYILTTTDGVNWIGRRGSAN